MLTMARYRYFFSQLPPNPLENALRQWIASTGASAEPMAMDGQDLKGARKQNKADERMTVAAFEEDSGRVMGQTPVPRTPTTSSRRGSGCDPETSVGGR